MIGSVFYFSDVFGSVFNDGDVFGSLYFIGDVFESRLQSDVNKRLIC